MNNELKELIIKNTIRDIQVEMLKAEKAGTLICTEIMEDILSEVENASSAEKIDSVPLTKEEAEAKGYIVHSYANGDYKISGIALLIRNGKEIATGKYVYSYDNGDYECESQKTVHKFNKDGEEITN